MNDQLQQALTQAIQKAGDGINFLQGQLPDVLHQLLLWGAISSGLFFALGAAFLGLAIWLTIQAVAHANIEPDGPWPILGSIGAFISACIAVPFLTANMEWLQILIAPKLYLIEYAAHLTGK